MGWDRVGHSVEHTVVLTLGAAVVVGGLVGALLGHGVEVLRHRHRI